MKPSIIWNEEYLLNTLPQLEEQDWVECKHSRTLSFTNEKEKHEKLKLLAKEVSALANAGGGYIVLGIDDKTKQVSEEGVNKKIGNNTKEWLENIIPSLVDPPLSKFNIITINRKDEKSSIAEEKAVYVVDIPDSESAPHQSRKENVYYYRNGSHSIPAGHQLIIDILGRKKHPIVEASFFYGFVNPENPNHLKRHGQRKVLIVRLENKGKIFAEYVNIILLFPKYLLEKGWYESENTPIVEENLIEYCHIVRENVIPETSTMDGELLFKGPGRYAPILPGRVHFFKLPLVSDFEEKEMSFIRKTPIMKWEIYADNMPMIKGQMSLIDIKIDKSLPYD